MNKMNSEEFIKKAKLKHGDKYDYSLVNYVNNSTKVDIVCKKHGVFSQAPYSHLNGTGCPSCYGNKKRTTETFIEKCNEVHCNKYDYSKTVYVNKRTFVTITCPIHGDFTQRAHNHVRGDGCPECGKKYAKEYKKNNYQAFINESKMRFGDIYSFPYIETEYENSHSKVTIKCNKCGEEFIKIACDHITSNNGGCQKCYFKSSYAENEIYEYISSLIGAENIIRHDKKILNGKEIDIYIPSLKIGIEYNGIVWHSELFNTPKNYNLGKTEMCNNAGIKLIQIFEDEYINNKELVLKKIKHLLGCCDCEKIFARKTSVKEITYEESKVFLDKNHIQGHSSSSVYIGSFYNEKLIGVMSFKIINKKTKEWELTRFACDNDYICCGVGGKLFNFFIKHYNPNIVKSFADRRWTLNSEENLYIKLGFKFDCFTRPDYSYINAHEIKRYHKFGFRKNILHKKYGLPLTMTESEMVKELKWYKIWNCGLIKYIWKK